MKIAILLVLLGIATSITLTRWSCPCTAAINELDCNAFRIGRCSWQGTSCKALTCADYTDKLDFSCGTIEGCAQQGQSCAQFTKCSDYAFADPSDCVSLFPSYTSLTCISGDLGSNKLYACKDRASTAPNCSIGTSIQTCRYQTTTTGTCYWDGAKCLLGNPKSCSDLTQFGSQNCLDRYCNWINEACVTASCTNQLGCTSIANWEKTKVTVCGGTPCAEVTLSSLTAANCVKNTWGAATWTAGGVCIACYALTLFVTSILSSLL